MIRGPSLGATLGSHRVRARKVESGIYPTFDSAAGLGDKYHFFFNSRGMNPMCVFDS
jgi:hypothetical protein